MCHNNTNKIPNVIHFVQFYSLQAISIDRLDLLRTKKKKKELI